MAVKYLKPGQDFEASHFSPAFGFTGSAKGRHDPRSHPKVSDNEYGDNLAKGGRANYQTGGTTQVPQQRAPKEPKAVPTTLAKRAALGALRLGTRLGARAAQSGMARQAPQPLMRQPAANLPGSGVPSQNLPGAPMPGATPAMRKGGKFLQKGIKRPGRMKNLAKRHGVSLGQEIARDVHSKDKSLRSAAILGRRLRSGDLSK